MLILSLLLCTVERFGCNTDGASLSSSFAASCTFLLLRQVVVAVMAVLVPAAAAVAATAAAATVATAVQTPWLPLLQLLSPDAAPSRAKLGCYRLKSID